MKCVVFVDDRYTALFRFHDEPRVEAKSFVSHLRPRHSVGRKCWCRATGSVKWSILRDGRDRRGARGLGVAFGRHTDITTEAADAVVMEPSLGRVDELIHIARRMRRIALQCAVGGIALSGVGMLLAGFGYLPPLAGAVAQEAIDLLAVVNAVRVAIPREPLRDF